MPVIFSIALLCLLFAIVTLALVAYCCSWPVLNAVKLDVFLFVPHMHSLGGTSISLVQKAAAAQTRDPLPMSSLQTV